MKHWRIIIDGVDLDDPPAPPPAPGIVECTIPFTPSGEFPDWLKRLCVRPPRRGGRFTVAQALDWRRRRP